MPRLWGRCPARWAEPSDSLDTLLQLIGRSLNLLPEVAGQRVVGAGFRIRVHRDVMQRARHRNSRVEREVKTEVGLTGHPKLVVPWRRKAGNDWLRRVAPDKGESVNIVERTRPGRRIEGLGDLLSLGGAAKKALAGHAVRDDDRTLGKRRNRTAHENRNARSRLEGERIYRPRWANLLPGLDVRTLRRVVKHVGDQPDLLRA